MLSWRFFCGRGERLGDRLLDHSLGKLVRDDQGALPALPLG